MRSPQNIYRLVICHELNCSEGEQLPVHVLLHKWTLNVNYTKCQHTPSAQCHTEGLGTRILVQLVVWPSLMTYY